ncbi:hypothetical protein EYZ11_004666 [Aspergillus tanneri]|uniref:Serine aminopeptidase S33 domain-containing protein n=1 Tax=Aspergillus tanneri TaxID=1220188 RepID=A0A4S3JJU8_9EURO|nr:uncharacterized protein ATNIH1004_008404 [Aspergillus tanneri]KAA8644205.1 hypothetical protein ATNIH1004_008404 [Aspergillus tanneri]THC95839.1 hypothetical protein EYZ11_004666 [Aspergillus tanneri]
MRSFVIALLGALLSSLASAKQAANFNLSSTTLTEYGCDETCQMIFTLAQKKDWELFKSEFDFQFYSTSCNFTGSQAGDLLKFEPVDPTKLDVVSGVSVYRFQYTSRSLNGSLVPASGFIGIPYTSFRKDRKYKVIAYAHGTIGLFAGCPPSTTPSLYDYTSWSLLVNQGYAIVAPDYAGLGNDYIQHQYLSFPAHANDLYYGLVAARKAFPNLFTREWMAVGHSQGGGAVWKLSESPLHRTEAAGTYLGSVALAPASKIYDMTLLAVEKITGLSDYANYDVVYESLFLPIAIKRIFPGTSTSFLTEKFLNRIALATRAQSCYYGIMSLAYGLKPSEMFTGLSALKQNNELKQWQNWVAPANGAQAAGPVMIVQGLNDTAVLPPITINSYRDACRYGNEMHLRLYKGMDHTDVLTASAPEWLTYISSRFAHPNHTHGECSTATRAPFDAAHMVTSSEVDDLIGNS